MRDSERQQLVLTALAGQHQTGGSHIRLLCPLCVHVDGKADRHGALSLNLASGFYECFKCGSKGRVDKLADDAGVRATQKALARDPNDRPWAKPPEGFYSLAEEPAASALAAAPAWDYLRGRGIADWLVADAGIGATLAGPHAGRVVVPIFDVDGLTWLGWVGRVWKKKAKRPYLYPPEMPRQTMLYNEAALLVETEDPLLVVEGVFDALALWPDAVAVLGKPAGMGTPRDGAYGATTAQVLALVRAKRPVAVVFDGDAHELGEALALRLRFEGQRAGYVRLPPRMDPDEIPVAELKAQAAACIEEPIA